MDLIVSEIPPALTSTTLSLDLSLETSARPGTTGTGAAAAGNEPAGILVQLLPLHPFGQIR